MLRRFAVIVCAVVAAACGDDGSSTGPSANVTGLTMDVPAIVRIGQTVQASATATTSRGTNELVGSGWRSSNEAVATVTDSGAITGVSNGSTSISVTRGGQQQQRDVRVLPNYEGTWSGTFTVNSCTPFPSSAYFTTFCAGYTAGTTLPVTMTLAQTGAAVTGQFTSNTLLFSSFVVAINGDGGAALVGTNVGPSYLTDALFSVNASAPGRMTGTTRWERRGSSGLFGSSVIEGTIVSLAR